MRKRKESRARRAAAILLSATLIAGMLTDAVPMTVLAQEEADAFADTETQKSDGGDATVSVGQETGTESGDESGTKPVEEPEDAPEIKPTNPAEGEGAPKPGEESGVEPPVTEGQDGVTEPAPDDEAGQETQKPDDGAEQETPEPGTEEKEPESVSGNGVELKPVAAPQKVMRAVQAELPFEGDGWKIDTDGKLTIVSDKGMTEWIANRKTYRGQVTSVEIQSGVKSIGDNAFHSCSGLQEITIPSAVEQIGETAFEECALLESITFLSDDPPTLGSAVFGRNDTQPGGGDWRCGFVKSGQKGIHVPDGKADAYKNATDKGWGDWAAYIADNATPTEKHEHDGVTFTAWTETDRLPDAAGNYYLTENVTLSDNWSVPDGTALCLNGKTISWGSEEVSGVGGIYISSDATLKLFDEGGGKIAGCKKGGVYNAGGSFYLYGGEISGNGDLNSSTMGGVYNSGTFIMYGGRICGNQSKLSGTGVKNVGSLIMYGGEISGNRCNTAYGAGLIVGVNNGKLGTVEIGGNAVITNNMDSGTNQNNFYINSGVKITISSDNPLSGSANIGVTTENAPTEGNAVNITGTNSADYSQYFHSDKADYVIKNGENNVVQLAVKAAEHVHSPSAEWSSDSEGHWHSCSGCEEKLAYAAHDYDDDSDTDCNTCGYKRTVAHTHNYGDWQHDSTQHWKVCSCGDEIDRGNHDFGDWVTDKEATATEAGTKHRDCKVCAYRETETIPATGGSKPGGGNKPGGGGSSGSGGSDSDNSDGAGDNAGGNPGDNGGSDGNNGSGNDSSGGNGSGAGTTTPKPGTSGTGQPKVKQEKEGNIQKEVRVEGAAALDAAVTTPISELADIVLTKEEKQRAAAGTDIKIVLDVKDASVSVSAADKALVEKALSGSQAKGYTLGQYLDISLYKVIGDSRNIVTETNDKITVTIDVPDSLKNTDSTKTRTFAVIRVHNGKAELLTDLDDNADTITIKTDRFSTYAVVYKDTAGGGNDGIVRVSVKSDGNRKTDGTKDDEPATGDRTPLELGATLSMIAGLTYLLLYFADCRHGMTEKTKRELVSRLIAWAKQGGKGRTCLALAAIFVLLVYYHSIGKKSCAERKEVCQ